MVYTASGTIIVSRFVKMSGSATVAQQTTSGGICIGVSQDGGRAAPIPSNSTDPVEAAQSGELLDVICGPEKGEYPMVEVGTGGLTAGGEIMSHTDGKGIPATGTGKYVVGIALETAVAGTKCRFRPCLYQLN